MKGPVRVFTELFRPAVEIVKNVPNFASRRQPEIGDIIYQEDGAVVQLQARGRVVIEPPSRRFSRHRDWELGNSANG